MERLIRLLGLGEYLSAFNYNFFCYEWKVKQASKYGEKGFWDQRKLSLKTLVVGTCGFIKGEFKLKSKKQTRTGNLLRQSESLSSPICF